MNYFNNLNNISFDFVGGLCCIAVERLALGTIHATPAQQCREVIRWHYKPAIKNARKSKIWEISCGLIAITVRFIRNKLSIRSCPQETYNFAENYDTKYFWGEETWSKRGITSSTGSCSWSKPSTYINKHSYSTSCTSLLPSSASFWFQSSITAC